MREFARRQRVSKLVSLLDVTVHIFQLCRMSTYNFRNMTKPDWYNLHVRISSQRLSRKQACRDSQISSISNFIWNIADSVLRDHFMRAKYRDVILPMTVIRRLGRRARAHEGMSYWPKRSGWNEAASRQPLSNSDLLR